MRRFRHLAAMMLLTGFLLGISDGRVALWNGDEQKPEQVYDIRADSLPPADRLILERGIHIRTRQELWTVLENYLD